MFPPPIPFDFVLFVFSGVPFDSAFVDVAINRPLLFPSFSILFELADCIVRISSRG